MFLKKLGPETPLTPEQAGAGIVAVLMVWVILKVAFPLWRVIFR
jgi:hypothetical protein